MREAAVVYLADLDHQGDRKGQAQAGKYCTVHVALSRQGRWQVVLGNLLPTHYLLASIH